ncbi:hypothetical protein [Rhizobium sp. WL3]|uniref:hypothetical protein n=1 Tax=Rhizobium sp. WL3 TaxID=2603277 RepID=UPI001FF04387|nr:hypothetical protein [Rhizobium sp. WL3]
MFGELCRDGFHHDALDIAVLSPGDLGAGQISFNDGGGGAKACILAGDGLFLDARLDAAGDDPRDGAE